MKGYTLIEILVAITIIGLVFGFGFVSFREFSRRQALSGTARNLVGNLRLAQGEALSGKKPDDIKCNPPNTLSGYHFRVTSSTSYTFEAVCTGGNVEIKSVTIPEDVEINTPSVNPILFKGLARGTNIPLGTEVTLTLTQDVTGNETTVVIGSSGDIK